MQYAVKSAKGYIDKIIDLLSETLMLSSQD